jgi:hypothetical protein
MESHDHAQEKIKIFEDLMDGAQDAIRFRTGKATKLRVTAVVSSLSRKPSQSKKIRVSPR